MAAHSTNGAAQVRRTQGDAAQPAILPASVGKCLLARPYANDQATMLHDADLVPRCATRKRLDGCWFWRYGLDDRHVIA
jgi:hypothetical protein